MRYLSLDLGVKSLGICVSDKENMIAVPLENYLIDREDWESALNRVIELVEEYSITTIVLGYPLNTRGQKVEMTHNVENFKKLIESKNSKVEVKLQDERFTTQRGVELLESKYGDKVEEYKDMAAAYVMLQDYIMYKG